MPTLEVDFCGVKLKTPVILASCGWGWDGERMKRCALAGAGAVIPKSIGPPAKWLQHPRRGRMKLIKYQGRPIGMVNIELYSTLPTEAWIEKELKIAKEGGVPIIGSIVANPDPAETTKLAKLVTETGLVEMIELNVSCPMPLGVVGYRMGQDAKAVAEQTKATKEGTYLPVTVKLTPVVSDIAEIAKAAVKAGADAISATNSYRSLAGIDIETGKPYLPAFGGYTGPAIKPIILRCVADIARAVNVPISAIGGVSSWSDAIEYFMVGAKTVQVCTAVHWRGPKAFKEICDGILAFMERKGYERIDDMVGIALKHITTTEELAQLPPMVSEVDPAKCNGCKLCEIVCSYDAIKVGPNKIAKSDPTKCDGCGICIEFCAPGAIRLVEKQ
jgi:dihydropyrimidine dehydrogenase (NAD+) subunit PreA